MPTTYDDIKSTSLLRNRYGRRKKGMFESEARYATGEAARPGSSVSKKFAKASIKRTVEFNRDGTYALANKNGD